MIITQKLNLLSTIKLTKLLRVIQLVITILSIEYVAFKLNIDNCSTAIMSAIVASQSFIGSLYVKARNRILGTLAGIAFAFLLAYLFPENPLYFLTFSLLWFTVTTILASLVHTDRAYLFQLAGYTFTFVGFVILEDPATTYHTLLYRTTDVIFGLVVMLASSSILFPNYGAININYKLGQLYKAILRFQKNIKYNLAISQQDIKSFFDKLSIIIRNRSFIKAEAHLNLTAQVALDNFLTNALLVIFYTNTLRFTLFDKNPICLAMRNDYQQLIKQLTAYKTTGLNAVTTSLKKQFSFHEHVFIWQAVRRGLRTFISILLMLVFWYYSAWNAGSTMLILATVYIILFSSLPTPIPASIEALNGTLQGIIISFVYEQFIFSSALLGHFSELFFIAQIPLIVYGGLMLTEGSKVIRGITLLTTFYFVIPPENHQLFIYSRFIDNSLGAFAGVLCAGVTLCVLFPEKNQTDLKVIINHIVKDLNNIIDSGGSVNILKRLMIFHDRIYKARNSNYFSDGKEDALLMDLASLYILCHHIHNHPPNKEALEPLSVLIKTLVKQNKLTLSDSDITTYLDSLNQLKQRNSDSYQIALCIFKIIESVHNRLKQHNGHEPFNVC